MLQRTCAVAAVAAVPVLLSLSLPVERVKFAPAEGVVLRKTFENSSDMTLDEMDILMNGEPFPMAPEMDMSMNMVDRTVVVDTYVSMADGQPKVLSRQFEELANNADMSMSNPMMGDQSDSTEGSSELEGQTVTFTWNEESGEYEVSFADDSEGDDELLEDLTEDMDLRALLPEEEVAVGDGWEIDPETLISVLMPGGDKKVLPEDAEDSGMPGGGMDMNMSDMLGDLSGEASAELTAVREDEGARIAVITVTMEIESTNDLTDAIRDAMEGQDMGGASLSVDSVDVELTMEGEGTLLWNLDRGHFVEFTMDAEMTTTMDQAMTVEMPGDSAEMEQSMTFAASTSLAYSAEEL